MDIKGHYLLYKRQRRASATLYVAIFAQRRMARRLGCVGTPPRDMILLKKARRAYAVEQMPTGVSGTWRAECGDGEACVARFSPPRNHAALAELACASLQDGRGA